MRPIPYVASLRVYEPIESFKPDDQSRWSRLENNYLTVRDEQLISLKRSILSQPPKITPDGAHCLYFEGKSYVAPWSTAARCWSAFDDLKNSLPSPVIKFFIPQNIENSIMSFRDGIEDKVSHILTSNWNIPPRWFALFTPEERSRGENRDGHYTILRTAISNAKSRCRFTHQTVLSAFGEGVVEGEIGELLNWLEIFHEKSIIELDYGGLATYLNSQLIDNGEIGLAADTSIEDVNTSIAGLASSDGALAAMGYEKLVSRWRRVSILETAT